MRALPVAIGLALVAACNPAPEVPRQGVGYRDGLDGGPNSGERGSVKISEILWSGSVDANGNRDPGDVYIELRNEGVRPLNLSGWQLEIEGAVTQTFVLPASDVQLNVGEHRFVAAKNTGCFPDADWVIPELRLPDGDPFEVTLRDVDDRLIEPVGSLDQPPFAGGYDLTVSRSMERVQLIFGGEGSNPASWHYYTHAVVDVPNDDRIASDCRDNTQGSPGRPNSPDYSGAYASGSFE